jgi:hypothetical protein
MKNDYIIMSKVGPVIGPLVGPVIFRYGYGPTSPVRRAANEYTYQQINYFLNSYIILKKKMHMFYRLIGMLPTSCAIFPQFRYYFFISFTTY